MPYREIVIPVDQQVLQCKEFASEGDGRNVCVVMVHGWNSSDEKYVRLGEILQAQGFAALAINLRGHKNSPYELEQFSRQHHEQDVVAAVRYIQAQHAGYRIVLSGKSYGGYLSALVAAKENVDFLILAQPALYPDEQYEVPTRLLIDRRPDIYKQSGQDARTNKAIRGFSQFTGPVLLIESGQDEEIPKATIQNYLSFANSHTTSVALQEADHALTRPEWREDYYRVVVDWLVAVMD